MPRSVKPDYGDDPLGRMESDAYDDAYHSGYAGKPQPANYLAQCCPNASARGYWDGAGDMQQEHA